MNNLNSKFKALIGLSLLTVGLGVLEVHKMCKEIAILRADGTADYVCTKAELTQRLGCYIPSLDDSPDNGCLCPLDEDALAQQTGYTVACGWNTPYHCDLVMTHNVKVRGPEAALSPEAPSRLPGCAASPYDVTICPQCGHEAPHHYSGCGEAL